MKAMETMKEMMVNVAGMGDMVVFRSKEADNADVVITCGDDGMIFLTDLSTEKVLHELVVNEGSVPSIAMTPEQTHVLVVSGDEHSVYSYTVPTASSAFTMDKLLFRSTVDIRQVVCSSTFIAIADEDNKVTVILRSATDQLIKCDGHEHGIKSVAIDPTDQLLCSASEDGTVRVFELHADTLSAKQVAMFRVKYQDVKDEDVRVRCAWHPDGNQLAVPVQQGVIELFDRQQQWKSSGQLLLPVGQSIPSDINLIAFSPNGQYLAVATLAKQVFVFSMATKSCLRAFKMQYNALSVQFAWTQNAMVVYHSGGKLAIVKDLIPVGLTPPHESGLGSASSETTSITPSSSQTSKQSKKKKKKKNPFIEEQAEHGGDSEDEEEEEDETELRVEAIKASFGFGQTAANGTAEDPEDDVTDVTPAPSSTSAPQAVVPMYLPPFQSGSVTDGAVTLLTWTPQGEIECIRGASLGENLIKVEFADKSRRGFKFTDNYLFSMAFLDEYGAFFAAPRRAREEWEDQTGENDDMMRSVVFYRPFESWASNSSWHVALSEAEDAECVAAAHEFCAVATSLHCLRIFTTSGVEYALVRLPGRVLTMTARDHRLAIVYYNGMGALEFQLMEIMIHAGADRVRVLAKGELPLSPPPIDVFATERENVHLRNDKSQWSKLTWLGFDDRLVLYSVDSFGCIQALGGASQWFPIGCVGNALTKKPADRHGIFPLGVVNDSLLYFPLEKGAKAPKLRGKHRPVPCTFSFSLAQFPTTTSSSKKEDRTTNVLWQHTRLYALDQQLHEHQHTIVREQAEMDKALILMMRTACANDETARALDLAKCLHLEKSLQIAQKLAMSLGLRQLHAQLYELYRDRFETIMDQADDLVDQYRAHDHTTYQRKPTPLLSRQVRPEKPVEKENTQPQETITQDTQPEPPVSQTQTRDQMPPVAQKPVIQVEKSVAPPNPFLKKDRSSPSSSGTSNDKKKAGLERLALFKSPPPKKPKKW